MIYHPGPQARRIIDDLRQAIHSGRLEIGSRLPPHKVLARDYDVAPLTMRHALSILESEGYISRQQGRGTFVLARSRGTVLIAQPDQTSLEWLSQQVRAQHLEVVAFAESVAATKWLEGTASLNVALINPAWHSLLEDLARLHPDVPVVALVDTAADLEPLLGTALCPVVVLVKPITAVQLEAVLRLTVPSIRARAAHSSARARGSDR